MKIQEKFDLTGRVAVVTGGIGLLGTEFCRTLAEAGAAVAVVDLNEEKCAATAAQLTGEGYQAIGIATNITDPVSVNAMLEKVVATFGRLDVLVNSAALDPKFDPDAVSKGIAPGKFEEYPLEQWNAALNVNLTGTFLVTQACVKQMLAQGKKGSIINICSTYGLNGPDQRIYRKPDGSQPAFKPVYYTVTKAGIVGFTKYLAAYYMETEIRVNMLTPGGVYNNHDETFVKNYSAKTIIGRMAHKDEMNGALLFLASDASSYMTGNNVVVDGGLDGLVMKNEVLAIIPARGGSKGIPRKNIRNFRGAPLIAWSIAAAKQSELVTRVIVSTDDEEIAAVARAWGAETPFLRPVEFAQDKTTDLPVFEHALRWLAENENYQPDVVIQLRPTSPIRPRNCVDESIRILLQNPGADSVRGVVPAGQNPHKMWRLPAGKDGPMQNLLAVEGIEEPYNAPRQILPDVYWQTGHIDAIRPSVILSGSMSGKTIHPLLIDPKFTVDLDNLNDWMRAEWLAAFGGLEMVTPGQGKRPMPGKIDLLVLDFDGVITDNRVWVSEDGHEMVAANRGDSLIMGKLKQAGTDVIIISSEVNPVVLARARKMRVEAIQGIGLNDKSGVLQTLLKERNIDPAQVVYIGNDINDLPCFEIVGWAVAVADAQPEVILASDYVTAKNGGHGAVREICDLILSQTEKNDTGN